MTAHDVSMNRYVIKMRRAKVRAGIKSIRFYRDAADRMATLEATLYFRDALREYRATMKALIRNA